MRKIFVFSIFLMFFFSLQAQRMPEYHGQTLKDIVKESDENIDIGMWALIIAKEYDNSVDVEKYLSELDGMASEIKRMLAGRTSDMDKFLAIRTFLYDAEKWNDENPFSYDLEDPLGNELRHQLLCDYMDSRKGNCVSMPTLFIALMERVDPSVQFVGVKAPLHMFCRLRDRQTGDVWNVEATNGGNPARNQWYIDEMGISQKAVDSRLYLKDLTPREYISALTGVLIAKERRDGNFEKAMEYTDLALKLSPDSDMALVSKGALYAEIGHKASETHELTKEEKEYYKSESEKYINKAKSLGWQPESKAQREEYMKTVKTAQR